MDLVVLSSLGSPSEAVAELFLPLK
jgi:hypothetical protein